MVWVEVQLAVEEAFLLILDQYLLASGEIGLSSGHYSVLHYVPRKAPLPDSPASGFAVETPETDKDIT